MAADPGRLPGRDPAPLAGARRPGCARCPVARADGLDVSRRAGHVADLLRHRHPHRANADRRDGGDRRCLAAAGRRRPRHRAWPRGCRRIRPGRVPRARLVGRRDQPLQLGPVPRRLRVHQPRVRRSDLCGRSPRDDHGPAARLGAPGVGRPALVRDLSVALADPDALASRHRHHLADLDRRPAPARGDRYRVRPVVPLHRTADPLARFHRLRAGPSPARDGAASSGDHRHGARRCPCAGDCDPGRRTAGSGRHPGRHQRDADPAPEAPPPDAVLDPDAQAPSQARRLDHTVVDRHPRRSHRSMRPSASGSSATRRA